MTNQDNYYYHYYYYYYYYLPKPKEAPSPPYRLYVSLVRDITCEYFYTAIMELNQWSSGNVGSNKQSTHQQQKDKEHQAHHLSLMDKEGHRDTANWMETVAERKSK